MPTPLEARRRRIDAIDERIAALLARRFALAASLKGLKKRVTDRARERAVLAHAGRAAGRRYAADVREVFSAIIKRSKKVQLR